MSINGFLLGAGASFEMGMPLVDEFTHVFKNVMLRLIDKPYYQCPEEIKNIVRNLLNDKELNYEEIIGRIEIEYNRNRNPILHQEWHWLLGRYNEALFVLLLEYHENNIKYISERLELFQPIKEFIAENPLWVFSLNHDLLIEIICNHLKLGVKYGFNDKTEINGYSFHRIKREHIKSNSFSFYQNERGVNLTKLHGALDVFVQGDEKAYLKLDSSEEWENCIKNIRSLIDQDAATTELGGRVSNEITYNDEKGILQFLRMTIMSGKHKFSKQIQHNLDDWFLKIFSGHINHVDHLYCIGYSFGDSHINDVIYKWVCFSEKRKVIIIDPHNTDVPPQFRHLKHQFSIQSMGFLEFLNRNSSIEIKNKVKLYEKARVEARKQFLKQ